MLIKRTDLTIYSQKFIHKNILHHFLLIVKQKKIIFIEIKKNAITL